MPHVTALYAGLLGILSIVLAVQTGQARSKTGITTGDGGNEELIIAMRRHANFVEFVPLTILLIGLLEMNGVSATAVHALGGLLLFARLCHAYGFRYENPLSVFRSIGAVGSTLAVAIASVWSVVTFF